MNDEHIYERRADGRDVLQLKGEVGELRGMVVSTKEGVEDIKESISKLADKVDDKFDKLIERGHQRDESMRQIATSVTELSKNVQVNADILNNHIKNDKPFTEVISNKVIAALLVIVGIIGIALVNHFIVPLFTGEKAITPVNKTVYIPNYQTIEDKDYKNRFH